MSSSCFPSTVQVLGVHGLRCPGCVDQHGLDLRHPHLVPLHPAVQHLLGEDPLALLCHGSLHASNVQVWTFFVLGGKNTPKKKQKYIAFISFVSNFSLMSLFHTGRFCSGRLWAPPRPLLRRLWVYDHAMHELCSGKLWKKRWKLQHPWATQVQLLPPFLLFWAYHDLWQILCSGKFTEFIEQFLLNANQEKNVNGTKLTFS